eukprot:CAMPEP_0170830176 /NCGR_PEP_ID=MMETSP0733-20121128/49136_1 /TAXON_ID=186038 /ORGANISM="Fragilariopsis kerguelensis, Strain L26-C5" /LENGTH=49 /DNA_ID= /DNA_START= /DNA_END= /DNA_ORIENTATION=
MGKKSKRKDNKPPCYHGCITKKEFNSGEHHKILDDFTNTKGKYGHASST